MPLKCPIIVQVGYLKAQGAELITAEVLYSEVLSPVVYLACSSPHFSFSDFFIRSNCSGSMFFFFVVSSCRC